jgi:hypothetical protein
MFIAMEISPMDRPPTRLSRAVTVHPGAYVPKFPSTRLAILFTRMLVAGR